MESPDGARAKVVGHIGSIPRESGGVAMELVVVGEARPMGEADA
ncbi:MAG: hypothetical protein ACRDQ0_01480 [Pseudonocardia sp.]